MVRVPLINCTLVPLNYPMILGSNNQSHYRAFLTIPDPSITSYPGVEISKQTLEILTDYQYGIKLRNP